MFNNGYGNILFYSRSLVLGYKMGVEPKWEELEAEYGDVPPDDDIRLYWEDWKMNNKREFLNDLEFEERLGGMGDRELQEFIARQTYSVCTLARSNERRINMLERRGNKFIAIVGGVGAFVGAIIIAVINYISGKIGG